MCDLVCACWRIFIICLVGIRGIVIHFINETHGICGLKSLTPKTAQNIPRTAFYIGGSRGRSRCTPPVRSKIFLMACIFWEILKKNCVSAPLLKLCSHWVITTATISLPINGFNAIKWGCSHCSGNGKGVIMNGFNANKWGWSHGEQYRCGCCHSVWTSFRGWHLLRQKVN